VNEISYDKWQAMIRLPYLTVLAFSIGQRARLYPSQLTRMLTELETIQNRDLQGLLGQLAADSAAELTNQAKKPQADEISHFPLQCARVLAAARAVMTADQFAQFLRDSTSLAHAMEKALPWHGRLRTAFQSPIPQDPRVTLRAALEEAALTP